MKKLFAVLAVAVMMFMATGVWAATVTTATWIAPTTNIDGTAIDGISGYTMYCGTTSGSYTIAKSVGNMTSVSLSNVLTTDGLYYCVVTVTDIWGMQSGYSNEVSTLRKNSAFFVSTGATPKAPGTLKLQ